jgi:hypothetical protein
VVFRKDRKDEQQRNNRRNREENRRQLLPFLTDKRSCMGAGREGTRQVSIPTPRVFWGEDQFEKIHIYHISKCKTLFE